MGESQPGGEDDPQSPPVSQNPGRPWLVGWSDPGIGSRVFRNLREHLGGNGRRGVPRPHAWPVSRAGICGFTPGGCPKEQGPRATAAVQAQNPSGPASPSPRQSWRRGWAGRRRACEDLPRRGLDFGVGGVLSQSWGKVCLQRRGGALAPVAGQRVRRPPALCPPSLLPSLFSPDLDSVSISCQPVGGPRSPKVNTARRAQPLGTRLEAHVPLGKLRGTRAPNPKQPWEV